MLDFLKKMWEVPARVLYAHEPRGQLFQRCSSYLIQAPRLILRSCTTIDDFTIRKGLDAEVVLKVRFKDT
jgi:hypothetical protein